MKRIGKLLRFFALKKYSKELTLAPLLIETTTSILAGLFMFIWGVVFFSNPLYQFSLFTKTRNLGISNNRVEEYLSDIYCIGIDPEARMALLDEEGTITQYDLIADAINVISTYARTQKDKRIVIGVDYAFAAPENVQPFRNILDAIVKMPDNLYIVFGGLLIQRPDTLTTLRAHLMEKQLIDPLYDIDPALIDRLFVGSIHIDRGSIRSGFESEESLKAAIGYYPIVYWGLKYFASLPLAMYLAGEIIEKDTEGMYDFYTDFGEGLSMLNDAKGIDKKLKARSGKNLSDLGKEFYYNFFTGKDITGFKNHFMWLSAVSSRFENSYMGMDNYFKFTFPEKDKRKSAAGAEYFFITQAIMPEFLLDGGGTNDVILTPATGKNKFTYENETVMGVMSHITALSNLKHRFYINEPPFYFFLLISVIVVFIVFLFAWTSNLGKSMLWTSILIFSYIVLTFVFFLWGTFIPMTSVFVLTLVIFGIITIVRFIYTTNRNELYEMVAGRVFSASHMEQLRDSQDWKQPKIIENGIIMVLFPRKLPDFGKSEEEANQYSKIYDKFLSLVFNAIENFGGNHLLLSMDGVLGFWNIPVKDDESEKKAFLCAQQCLWLVSEWQQYINRLFGADNQPYIASFDISLHSCECYAGCVGVGNSLTYSLSGFGINFAIEATLFRTRDKLNTLFLTGEFYEKLKQGMEIKPAEFETIPFENTSLYSWKKSG